MFLTKKDLDASLYPEISQLMSRYSDAIIDMNLATAEGEISTMLGARYDIGPELTKTGDSRHRYLLSLARDLAIYHLYSLQETIPAHRTKRYDQAIAMLKMMQDGRSTLPGVPYLPTPDPVPSGQIASGSNARRPTLLNPRTVGPTTYT